MVDLIRTPTLLVVEEAGGIIRQAAKEQRKTSTSEPPEWFQILPYFPYRDRIVFHVAGGGGHVSC
jgi:hypothetical protein